MLSRTAIYEGQQLTNILVKNGVVFTAKPLTPLESLVKASVTGELALSLPTATTDEFGVLLSGATQTRSSDGSLDHDLATADVVEMVAGVVARNLDIAKNIVNPICLNVLERVTVQLDSQVVRDVNNVTIVPDFYRELWNSPIFANLIEPFGEVSPEAINLVSIVPDQSDDEINALLITGAGPLDEDVADLVANIAPGTVAAVYREVFARTNINGRDLVQILNPYDSDRNEIAIAFLLARRLVDDVPNGVNANLADYRIYVAKIQAQAGFALNRVLALRARDIANKVILRNYPAGGASVTGQVNIIVNGDVYNEWLRAGGKPEAILGAFITDSEKQYDVLLEGLATYVAHWNRHVALKTSLINDEKYTRIIAALNYVVAQVISEQEEVAGDPSKEQMRGELIEHIRHIYPRDVDNFAHAVRKLVCKTMFAHTDAEAILSSMDVIAIKHPEMDTAEVALFATIDHVVTWISKLIDVKN